MLESLKGVEFVDTVMTIQIKHLKAGVFPVYLFTFLRHPCNTLCKTKCEIKIIMIMIKYSFLFSTMNHRLIDAFTYDDAVIFYFIDSFYQAPSIV